MSYQRLCVLCVVLLVSFLSAEGGTQHDEELEQKANVGGGIHPTVPTSNDQVQRALGGSTVYCDQDSTAPECCSEEQCELVRNSTVYSQCCDNVVTPSKKGQPGKVYPLLISATPRSGTTFMSMIINALEGEGTVVHDADCVLSGKLGIVSWVHIFYEQFDNNYFGPGGSGVRGSKFQSVWHLLRNPIKGLTSICFSEPTQWPDYPMFLKRHIELDGDCFDQMHYGGVAYYDQYICLLRFGMLFFTQWHDFMFKLKLRTFKLEDLVEDHNLGILDEIFTSMGLPKPNHDRAMEIIQGDDTAKHYRLLGHTNSRKHRPTLEWWELCQADKALALKFLDTCHRMGYYEDLKDPCDEEAMNHEPASEEYRELNLLGVALGGKKQHTIQNRFVRKELRRREENGIPIPNENFNN